MNDHCLHPRSSPSELQNNMKTETNREKEMAMMINNLEVEERKRGESSLISIAS